MKYYVSILVTIFILIDSFAFSDNPDDNFLAPEPMIGIDSLRKIFIYPDLFVNAFYETAFKITIQIDSIGNCQSFHCKPLFKEHLSDIDSSIIAIAKPKLISLKWKPAKYANKPVPSFIDMPVIFILKNNFEGLNHYYRENSSYPLNKEYILSPILISAIEPIFVICK